MSPITHPRLYESPSMPSTSLNEAGKVMTSSWRWAAIVGLIAGLVGPLCAFIWGLTKNDFGWIEKSLPWTYPFWWIMFYAEGRQSGVFSGVLLAISLTANILFFIALVSLLRWLYIKLSQRV